MRPFLDGVPRRLGVVAPPGRGRPPVPAVGELLGLPPGPLLEPMIMPAFGTAITQARPPARFIRRVVLEVAGGGGPPAHRRRARRMPDLGQMPQLDPGIMSFGCEPMLARVGADGVEGDGQVRAGPRGAQPPGAVSRRAARPGWQRAKVNPGGAGPSRVLRSARPGRAQPCPTAWPCWSVTVTHHVVLGLRAAASARSRASHGSIGPMPGISPGRSARSSKVTSGTVSVARPANPPAPALRRQHPAVGRESFPSIRSRKARARSTSMSPSRPAFFSSRAHQVIR